VAAIEPQPDVLQRRWEAIQGIVYAMDVADGLELVRLFHASPRTNPRFVARFRDAFKACDLAFPMRDNDAELQVLAGTTLVSLLDDRGGAVADVAALATAAADSRGLRPGDRIPDMLRHARAYLAERSAALRAPRAIPMMPRPKLDVDAMLEPLRSAAQARQTRDPGFEGMLEPVHAPGPPKLTPAFEIFDQALRSVAAAVAEVTGAAGQAAEELARRLRLQHEETNILWWLFGEHSRDLGRRMASLPLAAACLVAGKELADLTEVVPGPLATAGVLDRMLRAVEPDLRVATTIQEAVNDAPREWRAAAAADTEYERVEDLCPVLLAIRRSLDTSGPDDWIPPVRTLTGLDVLAPIAPLDLAGQVYEERLLVAALRAAA
jgi:hypothetical protein